MTRGGRSGCCTPSSTRAKGLGCDLLVVVGWIVGWNGRIGGVVWTFGWPCWGGGGVGVWRGLVTVCGGLGGGRDVSVVRSPSGVNLVCVGAGISCRWFYWLIVGGLSSSWNGRAAFSSAYRRRRSLRSLLPALTCANTRWPGPVRFRQRVHLVVGCHVAGGCLRSGAVGWVTPASPVVPWSAGAACRPLFWLDIEVVDRDALAVWILTKPVRQRR